MSIYSKFFKNVGIFAISNFASKILVFLLVPLYTHIMSTSDFGTSDLIMSIISVVFPVFSLCVSEGVLRFGLDKKWDKTEVFTLGLVIIGAGFIILLFFYPIIKLLVKDFIYLFYLLYLANSLNTYFNQFARALDKIALIGILGVLNSITIVGFNIIFLLYLEWGIQGYLLAYLLSYFISAIIFFYKGNMYKYINLQKIEKKYCIELLKYSIPLIPNRINWWLISVSNRYILQIISGSHYVGIYSAASRLPNVLTTIYGIVQQALQLSVIESYENNQSESVYQVINRIMKTILAICVVIVGIVITSLSNWIFGIEFQLAWRLVPILLLATYFGSLHGNLITLYIAKKETKILLLNSIIGAFISILSNFFLIMFLNLYGAAISFFITYFVTWLHLQICTLYNGESQRSNWRIIGSLTILSFLSFILNKQVYCIILILSLVLLLLFSRKDIAWLKNKISYSIGIFKENRVKR